MGANIPLPALQVKAPEMLNPLDQFLRVTQIKGLVQGQQLQQQQLEEGKLTLADDYKMRSAWQQSGGDPDQYIKNLAKQGVSPKNVIAQQTAMMEMRKKAADLDSVHLENTQAQGDQYRGKILSIVNGPESAKAAAWDQEITNEEQSGRLQPGAMSHVYPGDELATSLANHFALGSVLAKEALETQTAKFRQQAAAETARHNKAMEDQPTEVRLAQRAVAGDPQAEAALKRLDESKRASRPVTNLMTGNDAKDIADAIENGDQPPTLTGLYRNAGPVRAELARRGVPLAKMETDWKAVQRTMATLNGPQQVRLRQAITTASDSLDKIETLYNEWQQLAPTSGFKVLNKASLAAMKQLPGRPGAVAQALDAQIADVTSELGNVYMGGNSPTDHALGLAKQNLSADWNDQTFREALKQAKLNLKIRNNSILHTLPAGVSADSPYLPQPAGGGAAPVTPAGPVQKAIGPNGHTIHVENGRWVDDQTGAPIQ